MPSYRSKSRERDRHRDRRSSRKRSRSRDRSSERRHKRHKEKKRNEDKSPSKERVYAPPDVALELGDANVNMANLIRRQSNGSKKGSMNNGHGRREQHNKNGGSPKTLESVVTSRLGDIEEIVRERVKTAKIEMEKRLRLQIENELKEEMGAIQRREKESKERCAAMEKALEAKINELNESEKKLNDERLQMLEAKRRFEEGRIELEREKEILKKNEQQSILNKGGVRAPIRMKFGK